MKFILLAMVFLLACNSKKTSSINEKKMVLLIRDIAEAEVFVNTYLAKDTTIIKKDAIQKYCDTIFTIHKVTKSEFEESLSAYMKEPEKFKQILDSAQTDARKIAYFNEKMTPTVQ